MSQYTNFFHSTSSDWEVDAECSKEIDENPHMKSAWIQEDSHLEDEAKRICNHVCPVKDECLTAALDDLSAQGIRGGVTFSGGSLSRADVHLVRSKYGVVKTRMRRNVNGRIA